MVTKIIQSIVYTLKMYFAYCRIYIQKRAAYRFSFVLYCCICAVSITIPVLFVEFLYQDINLVAGWTKDQALLIVGSYLIIDGFSWMTFNAGLWELDRHLRDGFFDTFLMKPHSSLIHLMFRRPSLEEVSGVILGGTLAVRYLIHYPPEHLSITLILYFLSLAIGIILFFCIFLLIKSISFKKVDAWALSLLAQEVLFFSRYPQQIFSYAVLKIVTLVIIPIAFLGTIPASIIRGIHPYQFLALGFVVSIIFIITTRFVWKCSIRNYSSASS